MPSRQPRPGRPECPLPKWLRRLGLAGFLFFLFKGLLWLGLAGGAAMGLINL